MLCAHKPLWAFQAVVSGRGETGDLLCIPTCRECAPSVCNEAVRATGEPATLRTLDIGAAGLEIS